MATDLYDIDTATAKEELLRAETAVRMPRVPGWRLEQNPITLARIQLR